MSMDNRKDLEQAKKLNQQSVSGGNYSQAANSIQKGAQEARKLNQQSAANAQQANTFGQPPVSNFDLQQAKALNQQSASGGNYSQAANSIQNGASEAKHLNQKSAGKKKG